MEKEEKIQEIIKQCKAYLLAKKKMDKTHRNMIAKGTSWEDRQSTRRSTIARNVNLSWCAESKDNAIKIIKSLSTEL